jgi:hypothetical protein
VLLNGNITTDGEPTDFTYFNGSFYVAARGKVLTLNTRDSGLNLTNKLQPLSYDLDDVSQFILYESSLQQGN